MSEENQSQGLHMEQKILSGKNNNQFRLTDAVDSSGNVNRRVIMPIAVGDIKRDSISGCRYVSKSLAEKFVETAQGIQEGIDSPPIPYGALVKMAKDELYSGNKGYVVFLEKVGEGKSRFHAAYINSVDPLFKVPETPNQNP